ncbi:MAG: sugar phosphate nucleotidyltransferase [Spirochaetales bacterium]|nr:sugar phosphate nucleotidyltransferase [Spirochaetales bacterium]
MQKTVVIMAAGMGSRYGGLKQLDEVGPSGETIIDYSVYDAIKAGFKKIVFIIREDFDQIFRDKVGSKFENKVNVEYVHQRLENLPEGFSVPDGREKPWGTGHAMLSAASATTDPFIIINADDFYGIDAFKKASDYLDKINSNELKAALCGFYLKNTLSSNGTVSRGICTSNALNELADIEETHGICRSESGKIISDTKNDLTDNTIVSMNMWVFSPVVFNFAESYFKDFLKERGKELKSEFYIPTVVNNLINEEQLGIYVLETASEWYGVTYKEDKPEIVKAIASQVENGSYPANLWE